MRGRGAGPFAASLAAAAAGLFVASAMVTMGSAPHGAAAWSLVAPPRGHPLGSHRVTGLTATSGVHVAQPEPSASTSLLRTLYPPANATSNGTLAVDEMHTLYYEIYDESPPGGAQPDSQSRQSKLAALFLHGGPGAGCFPNHARFFDPSRYRVVLLDQRGCGRSVPRGETAGNTLAHLVEDCEALRLHLQPSHRWDVVLGGSWGTTLALAYAQQYSESVGALVLRGVCLFRPKEIDWLFARGAAGGAAKMNPGGWKAFEGAVGIGASGNQDDDRSSSDDRQSDSDTVHPLVSADRTALHRYMDWLLSSDPTLRLHAARAWMMWEMSVTKANQTGFTDGTDSADSEQSSPILVWDGARGSWAYQNADGSPADGCGIPPHDRARSLRRFGPADDASGTVRSVRSPHHIDKNSAPSTPRSIDPSTKDLIDLPPPPSNVNAEQTVAAKKFLPAQAMLTCFYSANDRFVMGRYHNSMLDEAIVDQVRNIPCIAIQGGRDHICPPDTAMDLAEAWAEMELRICLNGGHSMYDENITSEIVRATDRLADAGGRM